MSLNDRDTAISIRECLRASALGNHTENSLMVANSFVSSGHLMKRGEGKYALTVKGSKLMRATIGPTTHAGDTIPKRRLVIIESPFAGDVEANTAYARKCVRHSLGRGEAPIASHLLYTQEGVLNDDLPHERLWGIEAGLAWRAVAQASVVYCDRGISKGMEYGIEAAHAAGVPVEYRYIEREEPEEFSGYVRGPGA